ncbi:expression site-associated gene 8 (ESAG8)-associated protein-like, putative [Bodo saltans]|uniref:Expression site-associated gene 8 (ESAG8)-associated protein-like, putative n=1 Tax=Bodo saltans TaxID=75058 RepID=A0A0S4JAP2_BODSA|nr:expression site-associated gene 8 (ESAG8)-associated protein-like, putative [Bodo saltans]|eukprot:CUG87217.1 expression site-associated gene 8 (ESAG8)-associated protein-like, putative [Bodo saltans]
MFDFQFSHAPSDSNRHQATFSNVSPWTTAPTATSDAVSSPFFSHDFSGAFTDLTNDMGWGGRQEGGKHRSAVALPAAQDSASETESGSERSLHESPIAIPVTAAATASSADMLVKGDFLCASKLLQLAANSTGSIDQGFNHTARTSATSMTMDVRDDLDSPSRQSTPMSVANAVLYGTDDSPPIDKYQQRHHSVGRSLQREYSSFCVSAGESRDTTPVSPTHGAVDSYYQPHTQGTTNFGSMFTTQTQQQLMQSHRSQSLQRSGSVSSTTAGTTTQQQHQHQPIEEPSAAYFQQQSPVDSCARRAVRSHHVPTVVAAQKPTIVELASQQTCVLVLEFKMGRKLRCRCDVAEYVATPASAVGQYFIASVDSSGLDDAGVCTAVVPLSDRHTLHRAFGHSDQATILRVANAADCNLINDELPEMEEAALVCCHDLIHFLHLPFVCVDAEYSFDKKGCKVFYALAPQACTSIVPNVSRLQRELSCKMKCKMILEQVRQQQN